MKKMRKALLALLLSITVAGTSAAPVMAAGTNTSVPTIPAEESDSSKADKLFTAVKGDYIQLFKDALFDVKYNKYWNDDAAAVVGGSAAAEAVKTLKASVGSTLFQGILQQSVPVRPESSSRNRKPPPYFCVRSSHPPCSQV